MPFSSISTIFIQILAPVLENAASIKNTGKLHFAGVLANNRNQSYFIGVFLQTTPIVQKFSTVSIELIQLIRAYALPVIYFLVNTIYHYNKSHLLPFPQLSILYQLLYHISNTIISIYKYCYSYVIHCNYFVTIIISTLYSYIYRYILSIKTYDNQYRYKHTDSIIGMILNNTEINKYTVYSLHNYTIINIILVYSNFLLVYHIYLPLKQ